MTLVIETPNVENASIKKLILIQNKNIKIKWIKKLIKNLIQKICFIIIKHNT